MNLIIYINECEDTVENKTYMHEMHGRKLYPAKENAGEFMRIGTHHSKVPNNKYIN